MRSIEELERLADDPTVATMARTLWGEARGEGEHGMVAVAHVILNRARAEKRVWGHGIEEVCTKKWQFSCWLKQDPNLQKMLALSVTADKYFRLALGVADDAIRGITQDPTGGATHYHTKAIRPAWADPRQVTATIGHHIFYKGV